MRFGNFLRRFWSDNRGNIAVLFTLAIIPVIGTVGAAVDYSLASAYRTDLQKSLDATALALTKILPAQNDEALQTIAQQYFDANMGVNDLEDLNVSVVLGDGTLTVRATANYQPRIATIFGIGRFPIGAESEARWGTDRVEIALVLDNSLSMGQGSGRIEALRGAAAELLKVLQSAAAEDGDAKVGIVAFDGMVNINNAGYTHTTAPNWIRWDWWDANAYDTTGNPPTPNIGARCKVNGSARNFNIDTLPAGKWLKKHCEEQTTTTSSCVGASGGSQWQCQNNGGKWVTTTHYGVWTRLNRNQWTGCVYDRENDHWPDDADVDYDVLDDAPDDTLHDDNPAMTAELRRTKYPAAKCYATPPQAITPLNYNWTTLNTKVQALTPTGYTNITIGLAWGWHILSDTPLYEEAEPSETENLSKYIILMTDGDNTKNTTTEPRNCLTNAPPNCETNINNRTQAVCDNIKAAGIKIYAIRLISGNETLLQNCASEPTAEYYYNVQSTGALAGVFNSIGRTIANLHLAR